MLRNISNSLKGRRTYIVVIVAIIFNTLVQYGYVDPSYAQYVNIVLSALGLGALRAGISKV